jgi:hypothetical protein
MDVTEFGLRLVLLFIPGILCAWIVDALTTHPQRTQFRFTLRALILGVTSYGILAVFAPGVSFFQALSDLEIAPSLVESGYASAVAVGLAIVLTYVANHKTLYKIARHLRLSKRFGDQDVWSYLFNSPDVDWITVRDHERNLVYDGRVRLFSEESLNAELYLEEVRVYDNPSGEFLYEVAGMYMALDRAKMTIEIRTATLASDSSDQGA